MKRPEQALQRGVAELLSVALGGVAWFSAFPAGGGGLMRGKILKGMGLKPGVPDVLILDAGRAYWLELKAPKGTVTQAQKHCHAALGRAGCQVAVIRSLDDVLPMLRNWGIALKDGVSLSRPYNPEEDSRESYNEAVRACGERYKAGAPIGEFFLPERGRK